MAKLPAAARRTRGGPAAPALARHDLELALLDEFVAHLAHRLLIVTGRSLTRRYEAEHQEVLDLSYTP